MSAPRPVVVGGDAVAFRRYRDGVSLVELSGHGRIVAVTRGPATLPLRASCEPCCFALVALDGADNAAFARVIEGEVPARIGDRVRLAACADEAAHPAQRACFVPERATPDDA